MLQLQVVLLLLLLLLLFGAVALLVVAMLVVVVVSVVLVLCFIFAENCLNLGSHLLLLLPLLLLLLPMSSPLLCKQLVYHFLGQGLPACALYFLSDSYFMKKIPKFVIFAARGLFQTVFKNFSQQQSFKSDW